MNATLAAPKIDLESEKFVLFATSEDAKSSPYFIQGDKTETRIIGSTIEVPWMDVIVHEGKTRTLRYIASCNTPFMDEQKELGYSQNYGKTLKPEDRRTNDDFIKIEKGELKVVPKYKQSLIKYLLLTDYNGSKPDRDKNKKILFNYVDVKANSDNKFAENKKIIKARALVADLEGNYSKIEELATLFGIDRNMVESQILNELDNRAQLNPDLIINAFDNADNIGTVIADKALKFNIIEYNQKKGYFYFGTEDKIKSFKIGTTPDVAFKGLVSFLLSDDGKIHFDNLKRQIEAKSLEAAGQATN